MIFNIKILKRTTVNFYKKWYSYLKLFSNFWNIFLLVWICKIVDFAVPADHRINLKECAKKDKYLNLAWELKKLWNMKVTIVPTVIGAFGTVTNGLLKSLEDLEVGRRVETIQTTALLKMAWMLRRVLVTWGDLLSLKLHGKTISWRWCEKL